MNLRRAHPVGTVDLQMRVEAGDDGGLLNGHVLVIRLQSCQLANEEFRVCLLFRILRSVARPVVVDLMVIKGNNPRSGRMRGLQIGV